MSRSERPPPSSGWSYPPHPSIPSSQTSRNAPQPFSSSHTPLNASIIRPTHMGSEFHRAEARIEVDPVTGWPYEVHATRTDQISYFYTRLTPQPQTGPQLRAVPQSQVVVVSELRTSQTVVVSRIWTPQQSSPQFSIPQNAPLQSGNLGVAPSAAHNPAFLSGTQVMRPPATYQQGIPHTTSQHGHSTPWSDRPVYDGGHVNGPVIPVAQMPRPSPREDPVIPPLRAITRRGRDQRNRGT